MNGALLKEFPFQTRNLGLFQIRSGFLTGTNGMRTNFLKDRATVHLATVHHNLEKDGKKHETLWQMPDLTKPQKNMK